MERYDDNRFDGSEKEEVKERDERGEGSPYLLYCLLDAYHVTGYL